MSHRPKMFTIINYQGIEQVRVIGNVVRRMRGIVYLRIIAFSGLAALAIKCDLLP